MRKTYASQESVETTLTRAEREAPFRQAPPDCEPLPSVTRECVLVSDAGVIARGLAEIRAFARQDQANPSATEETR